MSFYKLHSDFGNFRTSGSGNANSDPLVDNRSGQGGDNGIMDKYGHPNLSKIYHNPVLGDVTEFPFEKEDGRVAHFFKGLMKGIAGAALLIPSALCGGVVWHKRENEGSDGVGKIKHAIASPVRWLAEAWDHMKAAKSGQTDEFYYFEPYSEIDPSDGSNPNSTY